MKNETLEKGQEIQSKKSITSETKSKHWFSFRTFCKGLISCGGVAGFVTFFLNGELLNAFLLTLILSIVVIFLQYFNKTA